MRIFITLFMLGQWTCLSFNHWPEFIELFIPFGILSLIYVGVHFYFSKRIVWWEFKQIKTPILMLGIGIFSIGFYQVDYLLQQRAQSVLPAMLDGQTLQVRAVVDDLPKRTSNGVQFNVAVLAWKEPQRNVIQSALSGSNTMPAKRLSIHWKIPNPKWRPKNTNHSEVLIPEIIPGQVWDLSLKLKVPRGLKNPYGFDVEQWMMQQQIDGSGFVSQPTPKLTADSVWSFKILIAKLRYQIAQKVIHSLGEKAPYSGVISALVMGDQQAISQEDWLVFNTTGIGHLISISGLHVTMFAAVGAYVANCLWRRTRLPLKFPAQKFAALVGFISALLYTFLAGFQVPAQRTMLMVGVVGVYLFLCRVPKAFDIWWWALGIVLLLDPWAIFTPGFCLSFGAVAAILYAMPPQEDAKHTDIDLIFLEKLKKSLTEAVRVQAVVTIALIPLTVWWFYQISLISPFANALAIPIVSFLVTPLAMLGVLLPWWLGDACLWLAHTCFAILAWFLKPMAALPWSIIYAAKPNAWLLAIGILGVIVVIRPGPILNSWKSRLLGLLACLLLIIPKSWLMGHGISLGEFRMLVWDIGQGSAVLIQTKNHTLLYDTGPVSGNFDPGKRIILPFLRASGIDKLDQLAISHQDADHVGGLVSILENFPVKRSIGTIPEDHPLQQQYVKHHVTLSPCQAGHSWQWDGVEFYTWHPHAGTTFEKKFHTGKPNEMSCVIEVRNQHHSVWLTGDVEKRAEQEIIERLLQQPDQLSKIHQRNIVLMTPHHGSKTSSNPEFVQLLDPNIVFSQSGYKNRYNHPHPSVVALYQSRGMQLLDTNLTGAQRWDSQQSLLKHEFFRK
ncbi:DNA internalization-related competence protein ComEC/Rec2 [Polynucleobacter kasalickyi]|nr:DNA internalization-related competence protein ComEC/Rec2 [Polynucleobacter kasalickyi]